MPKPKAAEEAAVQKSRPKAKEEAVVQKSRPKVKAIEQATATVGPALACGGGPPTVVLGGGPPMPTTETDEVESEVELWSPWRSLRERLLFVCVCGTYVQ